MLTPEQLTKYASQSTGTFAAGSLFHGGHWGQCLELLSHLCEHGESILLVSGPSGIGKSCMQQELQQQVADKFVFCEVRGTQYLYAETIVERIEAGLESQSDKDLLLLIDDAQHLTLEVLSVLLQLKQKDILRTRLHIVLFATPELEIKAMRSVLKEDFSEQVHIIEIEPLTLTEVEAFLMHQWRLTNNYGDLPFDKSKLKHIHMVSAGLPAAVIRIAKEMVSSKRRDKSSESNDSLSPVMVGVTVSFGILFCLLAFLWPSADDSLISKTKTEESIAVIAPDAPQPIAEQQLDSVPVLQSAIIPTNQSDNETVDIAQTPDLYEEAAPSQAKLEPIAVQRELTDDEKIARLEKKLSVLQHQLEGEQEARRVVEVKVQEALSKTRAEQKKTEVKKIEAKRNVPLRTSKAPFFEAHEQKIMQLPGKNYTLQLLGASNEARVREFIKANKLTGASYYKTAFKGNPWFVVIYGNYSNKQAAQRASEKLPDAVRKLQPWARELAHIHASIRKKSND